MKREDLISLLVYILMIVIAVVVGIYVISPLFSNIWTGSSGGKIGLAIGFVIVGILFNVILFEIGHIFGGKIGGYKILSVNMIGFCFYRSGEKWKFKFSNFDGLTGETKIAPKKENPSPKWFALLPLVIYVIEVALFMVIFTICKNNATTGSNLDLVSVLCIILITIGGMLELYNIFPARLDSLTDGYRLVLLSKKENIEAYNELMRIEASHMENKELNDMKVFDKITDFTASVNLYSVYKFLKEEKYDDASKILDNIVANKGTISKDSYCSAVAQKMFIVLLAKDYQEAKSYYDKYITQEERRYISNELTMQSIRAYLLISSMLDISEHEARYALSRVEKALKRTPVGRIPVEKELLEKALVKVDSVRPEWHIREKEVK